MRRQLIAPKFLFALLLGCAGALTWVNVADAADVPATPTVAELIEQLGSPEYLTRRRAEKALERLGFEAFDALKDAESHEDIEIATAARYLSRRIRVQWANDADSAEVRQFFQDYAEQAEEERANRAERLANLPDDAGVAALCRIVRFESSPQLSRKAALLLLKTPRGSDAIWTARAPIVKKTLGESQRNAAQWLRAQVALSENPDEALDQWQKLVAQEQQLLRSRSDETNHVAAAGLMRHYAGLLRSAGLKDDAQAILAQLIDLENGSVETLTQLVQWLAEDQAWELVDKVAARFADQFEQDPMLLYTLAEVKIKQQRTDEAEQISARAKKLGGEDSRQHVSMAMTLQQRGLFRWAEGEYEEVIRIEPISDRFRIFASYRLAEMLHDLQREQDAGRVLEQVVAAMDKDETVREIVDALGLDADAMHSRAEFFLACHEEQQKKYEEQRQHLERAIVHDPTDADVLIAMFRLHGADEAFKLKTVTMIGRAAENFREEIRTDGENPQGYNQFAWLIANTTGDYGEALAFSHRSLELAPERAGYLDTLGRCYYANGDLENAIKHQSHAVELEPYSLVIARQLKFFQEEKARRDKEQKSAPEKTTPEKPTPE